MGSTETEEDLSETNFLLKRMWKMYLIHVIQNKFWNCTKKGYTLNVPIHLFIRFQSQVQCASHKMD